MNPTFRGTPTAPARPAWTPRAVQATAIPLPAGFPSAVQAHYPVFGSYSLPAARPIALPGILSLGVFFLLPLLAIPLFPRIASFFFPRLLLFPKVTIDNVILRPPDEMNFFREMGALGVALIAVFILQAILAAFNRRKAPWLEAAMVGGLFAYAAFGVLRGFHALLSDYWLFPLPALGIALGTWLFFSALILAPRWRSAVS